MANDLGMSCQADGAVKIYQCMFSLIDAKGQVTKDVRISAPIHAETPRTFGCVAPAWGAWHVITPCCFVACHMSCQTHG